MITQSQTRYSIPNPRKPSILPDADEVSPGDLPFISAVGGTVGLVVGFISALLLDGFIINGPGIDGDASASGSTIAWIICGLGAAGAALAVLTGMISPLVFTRTYFTNEHHMYAHQQYLQLSPESRGHAQAAYDALAVFNTGEMNSERPLFQEARQIWTETHGYLRDQELTGDKFTQQELVSQARDTLKAIQN